MRALHKTTTSIALILTLALAACGGGGGGSADSGGGSPSSSSSSSSNASSSASSSSSSSIAWHVYDGSRLPGHASAITQPDGSKAAFSVSGNSGSQFSVVSGSLSLNSVNAAAATPLASFDKAFSSNGYPRTGSVLLRVTPGANFALNRSLDLRLALADDGSFGPLIELRLGTSGNGIQLEQWNGTTTLSANTNPGVDLSLAHTVQLNFTLDSATTGSIQVYIDGSTTPVLTASGPLRQTATTGVNHLAFGDAHDTPYQSTLDWLIWAPQAYLPAQLKGKLPADIGTITGY